jgi:hypothetical protein
MSDQRPSKDAQPPKDKLDELYALTKNETPPAELDLKILAKARARVPAQRSASIYTWQRIMSVAAVMVFSVYIFFDVRDLKQTEITDDMAVPQLAVPAKKSVERAFSGSELSSETSSERRPELKEEMALETEMQADSVEAFSAMPELASPPVANDKPEPTKAKQQAKTNATERSKSVEEDVASSPEAMLLQIRARLDAGEVEQAQTLLDKLKSKYPGLDIPEDILAMLELD